MSSTRLSIRLSSAIAHHRRLAEVAAGRRPSRLWLHPCSFEASRAQLSTATSDMAKNPIHILGAGSIGCLVGAQLSQQGFPVTFLQRSPPPSPTSPVLLQLIRSCGGSLEFPVKVESTHQPPSTASAQPIDRLIVTTKAHQLSSALASLGPRFDLNHTALVVIQNGYGQHLTPSSRLQSTSTCTGLGWGSTNNGAYLTPAPSPTIWRSVVHAGIGQYYFGPISLADPLASRGSEPCAIHLASMWPTSTPTLLHDLAHALPSATLHETSTAMTRVLLHKLAVNALINALTATHKVRNGQLLHPTYVPVMRQLADECAAVLCATYPGIFTLSGEQVFAMAEHVCELTSRNFSSTYQDVWERGEVPRELEFVHGTIVGWGRRAGVSTRTHEEVWDRAVRAGA
ncbi:ketopantoate reductase PanE/ApbA-domain-containing protein [Catenaria anguillulae PL171]|uniref:2-dehydropantoate 2-reductase n=1 Tax=Catenaria anguillulae PL171 TaxID=765915 RepID=A0A1Y2HLF7_9FUNG|nr:ketopantoate reductase PanE/ApbA-domain-containing protein [Catenaria anguillulae PL171]